jgi:hypothetical protein
MLFPLQKMFSSTNIEVFTSFSLLLSSLPKKLQHKQQVLHWLFFTLFLLAVVPTSRCEHKMFNICILIVLEQFLNSQETKFLN